MKAVGRPQKWTKMCRSGRKSVGARYIIDVPEPWVPSGHEKVAKPKSFILAHPPN